MTAGIPILILVADAFTVGLSFLGLLLARRLRASLTALLCSWAAGQLAAWISGAWIIGEVLR